MGMQYAYQDPLSLLFVDVFFAVKLSVKDCIMPSWLTSTDFVIGAPTGRHFGPEYSRHGLLFFHWCQISHTVIYC